MFFALFLGCYLNCSNISFHFKKYVEVEKFYTLISSGGGPEKWAMSKCEKRYLAVKKGAAHFWLKNVKKIAKYKQQEDLATPPRRQRGATQYLDTTLCHG